MNRDVLSSLISDFIFKNKIIPFAIGFALSFDQDDKPEVLIGICQDEEMNIWKKQYGGDAKYYIWNVAEYDIFEHESLYIDIKQWANMNSREEYIDYLCNSLPSIKSSIDANTGYTPYLFVHDLDDDDIDGFLDKSLSNEEINSLKKRQLL